MRRCVVPEENASRKATKTRVLRCNAGAGATLAFVALLLERSGRENSVFATALFIKPYVVIAELTTPCVVSSLKNKTISTLRQHFSTTPFARETLKIFMWTRLYFPRICLFAKRGLNAILSVFVFRYWPAPARYEAGCRAAHGFHIQTKCVDCNSIQRGK
jgi:hypothetical protein